ncbi:MAG: hypothetical protein INR73_18125 [Williamsia sp.]|nr:hypothetical protein [Williamsia sp.]
MPPEKVEQIEPCLSIQEDIEYQEKGWLAQRIANGVIFGLIILIAAGLFGNGPLANKSVEKNGTVLTYKRFIHHNGRTQLDVFAPATGKTTVISFPLSYLDNFEVENVVPDPIKNHIDGQEIVYTFDASPAGRISFSVTPSQWGRFNTGLKVNGHSLPLSCFIYP